MRLAKSQAHQPFPGFFRPGFFLFSIDFSDRPPRFEPEFDAREPNAAEMVGLF
jgi:hypothetical protein